jgi:hypothetical protein
MSYARFTTQETAQAYADLVQSELAKNTLYVATRWSNVVQGSDGGYYVCVHSTFPPDTEIVSDVPQIAGGE